MCDRTGRIAVDRCPRVYAGADVWELVELSNYAGEGAWPVAGGTLDQTVSFIQFRSAWLATLDHIRSERRKSAT
jgi:NADPH-dependent 7-cyano-7-deazaguanine reductase QueF-like protein